MTTHSTCAVAKLFSVVLITSLLACNKPTVFSKDRKYLGDWEDIEQSYRFAKVYYDGDALIWEDNEGKYPAKLENGQLIVNAGIANVTVQYIESSDHLVAAGSEFKRKRAS